jgi:hypothetical protein
MLVRMVELNLLSDEKGKRTVIKNALPLSLFELLGKALVKVWCGFKSSTNLTEIALWRSCSAAAAHCYSPPLFIVLIIQLKDFHFGNLIESKMRC